jgi:hypothetical protein
VAQTITSTSGALERLQSLCDIDLQERSNWLTLQVAIKVYKLRTGTA